MRCLLLGISWEALAAMDDRQMDRLVIIGDIIMAKRLGNLG